METVLKSEMAEKYRDFHPAFGRPGLVTFKCPAIPASFQLFTADSWGVGLGMASSQAEFDNLTAGLEYRSVWGRDRETGFLTEAPVKPTLTKNSPRVLDVIVAPDEPAYIGWHPVTRRFPRAVQAPERAPSRSYRKFAEALQFTRAPFKEGDRVLEFGGSPGGASLAMLENGLSVFSIDPGPMDPSVAAHSKFKQFPEQIAAFQREQFPEKIQWFVVDLGMSPAKALRSLQRYFPPYKRTLKGAFLTLKLNDVGWLKDITTWQRQLREFGLVEQQWGHLPACRQEVFVFGKTKLIGRY